MSPRFYQLGKRQDRVDLLRQRVVDAGRLLLGDARSYSEFTVDSVAKRAGVGRADGLLPVQLEGWSAARGL